MYIYPGYLRAIGLGMMDFPLTLIWQGYPGSEQVGLWRLNPFTWVSAKKASKSSTKPCQAPSPRAWAPGALAPLLALFFKIYSSHQRYSLQTLNVHLNGFNQELEGWLCEHHNFRTSLSPQSNSSLPLPTCLPSCWGSCAVSGGCPKALF